MQDPVKLYNPTKLSDFQSQNPLIDWTGILESLIPNGGIRSPDTIIVKTPEYYEKLNELLAKETTLLELQEYLIIQFITAKVYSLDGTSRAASHKMSGDISSGTSVEQPRWRVCVGYTSITFANSLGRYYTLKKFGCEAERKRAESFLKTIHDAWLDRIPHIGWLDDQTRAKAVEKVSLSVHYTIVTKKIYI